MQVYENLKNTHTAEYAQLAKRDRLVGLVRLMIAVLALVAMYFAIKSGGWVYPVLVALATIVFVLLMRYHEKLAWNKNLTKSLVDVNDQEITFLSGGAIPFDNGIEFEDHHHQYAYDLDVFGENSLFQRLNRTGTYSGKKALAQLLCSLLPNPEILENQAAIKELSGKLSWRQRLLATAIIRRDSKILYDRLVKWSGEKVTVLPVWLTVFAYVSPLALAALVVAFWLTGDIRFGNAASFLFSVHLMVYFSQFKKMQQELVGADNVKETILQYSVILQSIENEKFESEKLQRLQTALTGENTIASRELKKLSELFSKLDSLHNLMAVIFFSGTMMYHLHVFRSLLIWKNKFAPQIPQWLGVVGDVEALSSLANFSYNNPTFAFPELNDRYEIRFEQLGHPHIKATKRICNDVTFVPQRFMLLTGSNMSGKSTFLRSLGINMVLAGTGSPVCATRAQVHPLPVFVSMRLSDSLTDNESYFFAEIKRIKSIKDRLDAGVVFVLLDEILRGTNSDDKRSGTIAVARKMVEKKAVGAIATHDLEVCNITADYPADLINKCFEVEIVDNELHFDYRLRDGVCKNKSATFLMDKMGIV
jgi:MutS domain V